MRIVIQKGRTVPLLLSIFILLWMFGGILDYVPGLSRILVYIAFAVWFVLAVSNNPSFLSKMVGTGWPLYLLYFINFLGYIAYQSNHVSSNLTAFMYLCVVHAIFTYYSDYKYDHERNIIFITLTINMLIVGVITFIKLDANPNLARYLGTGIERYEEIVKNQDLFGGSNYSSISIKGVGSYGYFYAAPFLLVIFLYGVKEFKKRGRLYCFLGGLFLIVLCIKASFVTAMLISIALVGIMLMKELVPRKSKRYLLYFGFGTLIFLLLATGAASLILKLLSSGIDNPVISTRIASIADFLQGNFDYETNDFASRIYLAWRSITTFFSNPLIGTLGSRTAGRVGGHATAFDVFAIYGLFGTLFFSFLIKTYMTSLSTIKKVEIINLGIAYQVMILFLNNCMYAQIFIGYLIILPFGTRFIESKLENEVYQINEKQMKGNVINGI